MCCYHARWDGPTFSPNRAYKAASVFKGMPAIGNISSQVSCLVLNRFSELTTQVFYVANATYPFSAGWVKLALLFQYLRAYDENSRLRKWIKASIVVAAAWCLGFGFLAWFPCLPVEAYWNLSVPAIARYGFGSMMVEPFVATYTSLTTTNMILDLIILALAAPLLLYGKQSSSKRWALISLFCVGSM